MFSELNTSEFPLLRHIYENSDAFNTLDEIYLVSASKSKYPLYIIFLICALKYILENINQRTNGPVNAHLISWPSKAQNIQKLENIW